MTSNSRDRGAPPEATSPDPANVTRRRLPQPEDVVAEATLVSPKGRRYRVLRTDERDAYEDPRTSDRNK